MSAVTMKMLDALIVRHGLDVVFQVISRTLASQWDAMRGGDPVFIWYALPEDDELMSFPVLSVKRPGHAHKTATEAPLDPSSTPEDQQRFIYDLLYRIPIVNPYQLVQK